MPYELDSHLGMAVVAWGRANIGAHNVVLEARDRVMRLRHMSGAGDRPVHRDRLPNHVEGVPCCVDPLDLVFTIAGPGIIPMVSVAVTAEMAVRPDIMSRNLKPALARRDIQVSLLTLALVTMIAGIFPYVRDWVVRRTTCLPAQPRNRRWQPDSSTGRLGTGTVESTTDPDEQDTDGGTNLPPARVDTSVSLRVGAIVRAPLRHPR
jgi:hypothetical protein